jgi:pimeloyl-ACP methyl ester carboxylesterase
MAAALPTLAMPVEVVNGTADDITEGMRHAEAFAALVPGARVTTLPGVGHMPHHADPDAVVAAILRVALPAGA